METFKHDNKTYTVKNGLLYEVDKGLLYTHVRKGSTLEAYAYSYGFKGNIRDKVEPFHTYGYNY